ncbi:protein of unknown function [Pseudomonas sp. JV241A]|nr:protein of unknown function [Pseudomonas sp. JV241A]
MPTGMGRRMASSLASPETGLKPHDCTQSFRQTCGGRARAGCLARVGWGPPVRFANVFREVHDSNNPQASPRPRRRR